MVLWLMAALVGVLSILLLLFRQENRQLKEKCRALQESLKEKQSTSPHYTQVTELLKKGKTHDEIVNELGIAYSIVELVSKMEEYRTDEVSAS